MQTIVTMKFFYAITLTFLALSNSLEYLHEKSHVLSKFSIIAFGMYTKQLYRGNGFELCFFYQVNEVLYLNRIIMYMIV